MRWYEGGMDPLDNVVDVGPENEYEPDQEANPREPWRKAVHGAVEFAAYDPEQIMQECEEQDEMLGLKRGTTMAMLLDAIKSTH